MKMQLITIITIIISFLHLNLFDCKNIESSLVQKVLQKRDKSNWCCSIDPPPKPVFSEWGDLLYYEPQRCPKEYLVCCKGHLNINGNCLDFNEIKQVLPNWQQLAELLGVSTLEAMNQINGNNVIG